jgi:hypothetical protein
LVFDERYSPRLTRAQVATLSRNPEWLRSRLSHSLRYRGYSAARVSPTDKTRCIRAAMYPRAANERGFLYVPFRTDTADGSEANVARLKRHVLYMRGFDLAQARR